MPMARPTTRCVRAPAVLADDAGGSSATTTSLCVLTVPSILEDARARLARCPGGEEHVLLRGELAPLEKEEKALVDANARPRCGFLSR